MKYTSGLGVHLPHRGTQGLDVWARQVALAIEAHPVGQTAPCQNPECAGPVDRLPSTPGPLAIYCGRACRNRAMALRRSATQQLEVIDQLLALPPSRRRIPTQELRERALMIRWWLARIPTIDDRAERTKG